MFQAIQRGLSAPRSLRGSCMWRSGAILVAASLVAGGCRDPGPTRGAVEGRVSLGGQDLAEGVIRFFPLGDGIGSDGPIAAGRYAIPGERGLSRGTYRVEISALKATGRRVPDLDAGPGDMKDEVIETVPSRYNRDSELQLEFDPDVIQSHDFQLTGSR
jgi:hypothetical protein